jgi:hypothetical protein
MLQQLKKIFGFKSPHFLITSTGYSGNWWLASSLHLHPEIKCSMGLDALPAAFDYYYNSDEITQIFKSGPNWLKHGILFPRYFYIMLDNLESKGFINAEEKNKYRDEIGNAETRNINDLYMHIFNELKSTPFKKKAKITGNVHGLSASQFKAALDNETICKSNFDPRKIPVFDLIRHPVTRLDTFVNYKCQWYDTEKYGSYIKINVDKCLKDMPDEVKRIEKLYNVDFSMTRNKVYFFIEHINSHLLTNFNDVNLTPEIPRIQFELMRNDRDYFKKIFSQITHGMKPDETYLNLVFSPNNLNQGRASEAHLQKDRSNPELCFDAWSDWEKSRFKERVVENNLVSFYAKFNYDLSFTMKA